MGKAEERCRVDFSCLHKNGLMFNRKRSRRRKKKPLRTRTKFVIAAMVNISWYTIAVLAISCFDHTVPSELTVAWTVKLVLLAGIKVKSRSSGDDSNAEG
ncbi:MAG: hypothetical protein RRY97_02495 [Oscillibacter sp.]